MRINEEVNKDAEHLIMLNLIVFPYLCVNLKQQKIFFVQNLFFTSVLKQRRIIKQNVIIFYQETVSKMQS